MDQFTTDISNALNDTNILTSSSSPSKAKRRRKRIINNKIQKQRISESDSTDNESSKCVQDTDHIPHVISWWDDNEQEKCENDDQMLTTSDETLQNIVNGALNIMLASSKVTIQNRIKTFADRKVLTGNRRQSKSQNSCIHRDSRRHVRLSRNAHCSNHPYLHNDIITPINSTNVGHQLLEKIGWTPGNGLGVNQNGIRTPIEINFRNHKRGLGFENISIDSFSNDLFETQDIFKE